MKNPVKKVINAHIGSTTDHLSMGPLRKKGLVGMHIIRSPQKKITTRERILGSILRMVLSHHTKRPPRSAPIKKKKTTHPFSEGVSNEKRGIFSMRV
jgi:hypothetical protein